MCHHTKMLPNTNRFFNSILTFLYPSAELQKIEVVIGALLGHQFGVAASFYDLAVVKNEDLIDFVDGGETVGYDHACAADHKFVDGVLNKMLGGRIDVAGRFVEDQYPRVVGQSAGEAEQLFFAGGERRSAFRHHFVVAVRQFLDELVGADRLCGFDGFLPGNGWIAQGDVLIDGAAEDKSALQNDGDVLSQFLV